VPATYHLASFRRNKSARLLFNLAETPGKMFQGTKRERTFRMKLRHALAALTAVTAVTMTVGPARAQTYDPAYPVCLQIYQGGMANFYFECRYRTMGQCQASASGRAAQCVVNPYYGGDSKSKRQRQQRYERY
jgi:hypothetical protein